MVEFACVIQYIVDELHRYFANQLAPYHALGIGCFGVLGRLLQSVTAPNNHGQLV
ncbi:MAG TPA: hypothetical protein VIX37_20410 [Candidatus Sulfotelmatobacter sp.]